MSGISILMRTTCFLIKFTVSLLAQNTKSSLHHKTSWIW